MKRFFALALMGFGALPAAPVFASMMYCLGDDYLAVAFDSTATANGSGKVYVRDARGDFDQPLAFTYAPDGNATRMTCDPGGFRITVGEVDFPFDLTAPGRVIALKKRPAAHAPRPFHVIDAACRTETVPLDVPRRPNTWTLTEDFEDAEKRQRVYRKRILLEKRRPSLTPPGEIEKTIVIHIYPVLCEADEYDR